MNDYIDIFTSLGLQCSPVWRTSSNRHPDINCRIYSFDYSVIIEKNLMITKVVIFQHCLKKTFVDIRNRHLLIAKNMHQTLALHSNKHLKKIRPHNIPNMASI